MFLGKLGKNEKEKGGKEDKQGKSEGKGKYRNILLKKSSKKKIKNFSEESEERKRGDQSAGRLNTRRKETF